MELSNLRGYDPHCSWPLYESPHLFCGLPFLKSGHTFPLVAGHTTPLTQAWNNDVLSLDLLSAVIVDGFIYGFDVRYPQTRPTGNTKGIFKCAELAIGIERWSSVIPGHASVTACGDSLILLNEAGTLMIAELSSEVYREVARRSLRLMALIRGTALHCPLKFGKQGKWFSALVRISSIMGGSGESES